MRTEVYDIGGMHCAACSSAVERVTRKLPGVERSDVNLPMNRMTIVYDEEQVGPENIISKVEKAGFTAKLHAKEPEKADVGAEHEKELKAQRNELIAMAVLSVLLLYVSMGSMLVENLPLPTIMKMDVYPVNFAITQLLLTLPTMFLGRRYFVSGYNSLFHGNPNMDSLVAVSCTASLIYSVVMTYLISADPHRVHELYYESAAVVLTLISLGKHLEANSQQKTKTAITRLMELAPETAILVRDDGQWEVPTESLKPGDTVLVKAGARFPLDGVVKSGSGSVDEAMLTGESLPVDKTEGSAVIGGSIAVTGAMYVEITKVGEDTTLSKIISFVEEAQGKKAPISRTADKVAGVFVPVVGVIAILAAAVWLIAGQSFSFALKVFTTVLVIACPCAMGLATPTAIIVATGKGAENGILIRSGEALETAGEIDVAILDKTGTVTEGKPRVTKLTAVDVSEEELLRLAASAEALSEHPLAQAICEEASKRNMELLPARELETLSGLGLRARVGERALIIGNGRLMEDAGIDISPVSDEAADLSAQGQTPMFVAADGALLGLISVMDTVKDTSAAAIKRLRELGVETVLLTGDNRRAAEYISGLVGTDRVIAEVMPVDKAGIVKEYQEKGKKVLMVGDGINDAPALAQADVGCAIGSGSDIAIESADIVLMKSDPGDVPRALNLSRMTIRNIRQNLFWAFCYNVLGIPVAAGALYPAFHILLSPMIGGIAMSLSSLFVVTNALRLRGKKL